MKTATARRVLMLMGWYNHASHSGIARYARDAGWILDSHSVHIGHHPSPNAFDGVICYLYGQPELTTLVRGIGKPMVDLQWQVKSLHVPRVLSDNLGAGALAARHLLERGFKRFVYAAPDARGNFASRERLEGFRDTLAASGHRVTVLNGRAAVKARQAASIYKCADWLARQLQPIPKPFAVFCTNDDFAVEVLDACAVAEILVPEEAAIVGCDNDELICPLAAVPLTSVDLALEEVAYRGAKLLDRLMDGKRPPRHPVRVPCRGIVTRRSSDILAIEHLGVAKALRFILDRHTDPLIGVADAAAAAGMSRRGLGLVFHRLVGRHVGEEIARVRLEKAMAILAAGGRSATDVAAACGYSGLKHFSRALIRATGAGPRQFMRNSFPIETRVPVRSG
jgi:LacI family transcriptional regulator